MSTYRAESMHRLIMALAVLSAAVPITVSADQRATSSIPALHFTDPSHWGFLAQLGVGWEFTANADMTVTYLGYYDSDQNGLSNSHPVGIFDVQDGQLLGSITVTPADPLIGFFRYAPVEPFELHEGKTYFIAGLDPANPADRIGIPAVDDLVWANTVTFTGWDASSEDGLDFPSDYEPTTDPWANSDGYMITANFRYLGDDDAVIYVDDDAPPGGDGHSWNTAHQYLQDALANAASSAGLAREIRVGQGEYRPDQHESGPTITSNRDATFRLADGVSLIGGYAGFGADDPDARNVTKYRTTLSGDLQGDDEPGFENIDDNSLSVVSVIGAADVVIDGVTIRGGNADMCAPGMDNRDSGGGLYLTGGEVSIANCCFTSNSACAGGAILLANGELSAQACTFAGNRAYWFLQGSNHGQGGGVHVVFSAASFANCVFVGHTARYGGGIFLLTGSSLDVCNSTFAHNDARNGGAIMVSGSPVSHGVAVVRNSICWGNTAEIGTLEQQQIYVTSAGELDIEHSNVQGWTGAFGGIGNVGSDPMFRDADGVDNQPGTDDDDLRLTRGSPCLDAADNLAVPEGIMFDRDGNPRFVDDPNAPDCPHAPGTCGGSPIADMGAYEFQPFCAADITGPDGAPDGNVDALDFLLVLAEWGSPCAGECRGDITGPSFVPDGNVDASDLALVQEQWGTPASCQ